MLSKADYLKEKIALLTEIADLKHQMLEYIDYAIEWGEMLVELKRCYPHILEEINTDWEV